MRISDWSSDVCSSDLVGGQQVDDLEAGLQHLGAGLELGERRRLAVDRPVVEVLAVAGIVQAVAQRVEDVALDAVADRNRDRGEIGRASGRERVCPYVDISGVAGALKKKD